MLKRIFLFLSLNILIVLTVSLLLNFFHIQPYIQRYGLDYRSLAIFCLIWGMTGAVISLLLSRSIAKMMMGVRILDPLSTHPAEAKILACVEKLAQRASLGGTPQVGIFTSSDPNAFATGSSKRRSMVAVSTGLIEQLSDEEIEGVLAHEISHIANGDMVTMTLLQGLVNAFVMFLSRILAYTLSMSGRNRDNRAPSYMTYALLTMFFELIFMLFGSVLIAYFSRSREFRADRGSAELAGKKPMIAALKRLQQISELKMGKRSDARNSEAMAALMIQPVKKWTLLKLFASHPPIEERIRALEAGTFDSSFRYS